MPHLDPVNGEDIADPLLTFPGISEKGFLMSEQAAALVERSPVDDGVIEAGGRMAVGRHLHLVEPESYTTTLTSDEAAVMSLISEGNTLGQVGKKLGIGREEVLDHRGMAMSKYGAAGVTAGVNRAILDGEIAVEVKPDPETAARLSSLDKRMLTLYAKGLSNGWMAGQYGIDRRAVEDYHDGLLERVGAWNRPHAIRRMHELGLWQV